MRYLCPMTFTNAFDVWPSYVQFSFPLLLPLKNVIKFSCFSPIWFYYNLRGGNTHSECTEHFQTLSIERITRGLAQKFPRDFDRIYQYLTKESVVSITNLAIGLFCFNIIFELCVKRVFVCTFSSLLLRCCWPTTIESRMVNKQRRLRGLEIRNVRYNGTPINLTFPGDPSFIIIIFRN